MRNKNKNLFRENRLIFKHSHSKKPESLDGHDELSDVINSVSPDVLEELDVKSELGKEKAKTKAKATAKRKLEKAKIEMTRVEIPETPPYDAKRFRKEVAGVNPFKLKTSELQVQIESHVGVDPLRWKIDSPANVDKTAAEFQKLGLNVKNDPLYQTMFAILRNGVDAGAKADGTPKNPHYTDYSSYFLHPAKYHKELKGLGSYGENYFEAYKQFQKLQGEMIKFNKDQLHTLEKQENLDKDTVAGKTMDFLKANMDKFKKAIVERDYATAGMYAVGVWAIWKSLKELKIVGKDGKGAKWFAYGAALYVGSTFAKNAGYDVLKMTGLKGKNYEVKGTPMEYFTKVLKNNPEYKKTSEKIDHNVLARCSEVNLVKLNEEFEKSRKAGITMIDLTSFSDIFPIATEVGYFDIARGEKGIDDNTGNSNIHHTPKQRAYIKLAKQMYLIAMSVPAIYKETLQTDKNSAYHGLSYKEMLNSNEATKLIKLRHLMGEVAPYGGRSHEKGLLRSAAGLGDVKSSLDAAFKGKSVNLDIKPGTGGHYPGYFMGMPVMIVENGKEGYKIYLKEKYGTKNVPGNDFIKIPAESGNMQEIAVDSAIKEVEEFMGKKLEVINSGKGRQLSVPKFDGRIWTCKVRVPAAKQYNIDSKDVKAILTPRDNGSINVVIEGTPITFDIDKGLDSANLHAFVVLGNMVMQKDMKFLAPMLNTKRLEFVKDVATKGDITTFEVKIAGKSINVTFDKKSGKYAVDSNEQSKLLASPAFRSEYVGAISESVRFTGVFNRLGELVDQAPESFVLNSLKSASRFVTEAKLNNWIHGLNGDFMDGSVKDYYTKYLLEFKKQSILQSIEGSIANAKSFSEAQKKEGQVLSSYLKGLEDLASRLSSKNDQLRRSGDSWSAEEFSLQVIKPIFSAGVSNRYAQALMLLDEGLRAKYGSGNEISSSAHEKRLKVLKRFTYLSGRLDSSSLNSVTPSSIAKAGKDTNKEKYYKVGYLRYLREELLRDPEATSIMVYEKWKESPRKLITGLEPMEDIPPMNYKEIKATYKEKLRNLKRDLLSMDDANAAEIEGYFSLIMTQTKQFKDECKHMSKNLDTNIAQRQYMDQRLSQISDHILSSDQYWSSAEPLTRLKVWWKKLTH